MKIFFYILSLLVCWLPAKPILTALQPVFEHVAERDGVTFYRALQMTLAQTGYYQLLSPDEVRFMLAEKGYSTPPVCATQGCFLEVGRNLNADLVLGTEVLRKNGVVHIDIRLYGIHNKSIIRQLHLAFAEGSPENWLELARVSIRELTGYPFKVEREIISRNNPYPNRLPVLMGTAAVLGSTMAYLYWNEGVGRRYFNQSPRIGTLHEPGDHTLSALRGFFATHPAPARFRAMGKAGSALAGDVWSPLMNPAGLANMDNTMIAFSRMHLPGGIPYLYLAGGSPLVKNLYQAQAIAFEGDDLASEMIFYSSYATDLTMLSYFFSQLKMGVSFKGLFTSVGREGVGQDRSRGYSRGFSLDIGFQWAVYNSLHFSLYLKDMVSWLQHTNTYTRSRYEENLPGHVLIGSWYRVNDNLNLVLDAEKGLWLDQTDKVSLGAEYRLFQLLWLRGGLFKILNQSGFQTFNLGAGITQVWQEIQFSLDYSFEYGYQNSEIFSGIQNLGIQVSF
jgi:hypothetical protein